MAGGTGNSGALVCLVTRGDSNPRDPLLNLWEEGANKLQASYDQFIVPGEGPLPDTMLTDLKIVILHLAIGGVIEYISGQAPPILYSRLFPDLYDTSFPFLEIERTGKFHPSVPGVDSSGTEKKRGYAPEIGEYLHLVDDVTPGIPDYERRGFVQMFSHRPAKMFFAVSKRIINDYDRFGRNGLAAATGLMALGVSSDAKVRVVAQEGGQFTFAAADHYMINNNLFGRAMKTLRSGSGIGSEVCEYNTWGLKIIPKEEVGPPIPEYDKVMPDDQTIFHVLAQLLDRVFKAIQLGNLTP